VHRQAARGALGLSTIYGSYLMSVRVSSVVALIAAGTVAGCASGDGSDTSMRTESQPRPHVVESLEPISRAAVQRCSALASRRDIPVLCPTRLPSGKWQVRYQTLRGGRREYLCNLETKPSGSGDAFHVLAGGRSSPFPLRTTVSGQWPRDTGLPRDLGLIGAKPLRPRRHSRREKRIRLRLSRRTTVAAHPALILRVADYPDGGVHGGHVAAVWNQGGAGYVLSVHFGERNRYTRTEREAVLLQAASGMSRFTASRVG
jgi:hypothetical protein